MARLPHHLTRIDLQVDLFCAHVVSHIYHGMDASISMHPGGNSTLKLPGCVSITVMDMDQFLAPSE